MNAGLLQLDLAGGVTRFLSFVEGIHGLVEILEGDQRPAQIKVSQSAFRMAEMLDRFARMAQEKEGNAELELPFLDSWARGCFEFFLQGFGDLAERTKLRAALREAIASLLNGARVAIFTVDA